MLPISHVQSFGGRTAIAVDDPGLRALLRDVGAVLTWNRGDRYVLFTTAEPRIVSFAVGDTRYDVGPVTSQASFAPYEYGNTVYVPFDELLHALYLAAKPDGHDTVIQPQLAAIDVQASEGSVRIVGRAGVALHPKVTGESQDRVVYSFEGVGTTLQSSRAVNAQGVREIQVAQSGSVRAPTTDVTLVLAPGATHGAPTSDDGRDFVVSISGAGANVPAAAGPVAVALPTPAQAPLPTAAPTQAPQLGAASGSVSVTAVDRRVENDTFVVSIAVSGDTTYQWSRLGSGDNRFWINIDNARLDAPEEDDNDGNAFVKSVRVHQNDTSTVRVALTLQRFENLAVTPTTTGVQITVYSTLAPASVAHSGSGGIGAQAVAEAAAQAAAPASPTPTPGPWKFAQHPTSGGYVATNPRLIVIDPGHGGSDPGAVHGGQSEKNLTLDMALRLRDVLVAQGWQVIMTRDTDVDVYKPYDSAPAELQARDDVANKPGARMFVSIHVNSYLNAAPHGTTTYYSKPEDVPLAKDVQHALASSLGTADDGIIKSHYWVTLHAKMPAILIETAFLTNPGDFARLTSPAWRQKVAEAIARGITDYAGNPPAAPSADQ